MRRHLVLAMLCLGVVPAGAQSLLPGPASNGRYALAPVDGGVARLDTVSGEVSLCRIESGIFRCRPAEESDSAAAPTAPAAAAPSLAPGAGKAPQPDAAARAEDEAEFDRSIDRMKRFFRAFGDIARDFDSDRDGPSGAPEATPNRT